MKLENIVYLGFLLNGTQDYLKDKDTYIVYLDSLDYAKEELEETFFEEFKKEYLKTRSCFGETDLDSKIFPFSSFEELTMDGCSCSPDMKFIAGIAKNIFKLSTDHSAFSHCFSVCVSRKKEDAIEVKYIGLFDLEWANLFLGSADFGDTDVFMVNIKSGAYSKDSFLASLKEEIISEIDVNNFDILFEDEFDISFLENTMGDRLHYFGIRM